MAAVGENDSSLAIQCLALCQSLERQGKVFKLSLTIGNAFSFSMESRGGTTPVPINRKKRASPSTVKRNARRRSEFLARKRMEVAASKETQADVEYTQQMPQRAPFPCDQCDLGFKTGNGLKIHVGKSHKVVSKSPEKIREQSSTSDFNTLVASPIRDISRVHSCHNCDTDMSPTHQCPSGQDSIVNHCEHDAEEEKVEEPVKSKADLSAEQRALFGQVFSMYSNLKLNYDTKVT